MVVAQTWRHALSVLVVAGAVGCTSIAPSVPAQTPTGSVAAAESLTPSPTAKPTTRPTAPPPAGCVEASDAAGDCQLVHGTANIFGAGRETPPAPGGGGGGTLPPMWPIPAGASALTVTAGSGVVKHVERAPGSGASGFSGFGESTDVASHEGISGIVHRTNTMFLVGVFLTDQPPQEPAPERLDAGDAEGVAELAPAIGQTFFIGDGLDRTFVIPDNATRIYIGFADAFFFQGAPGWYSNNSGHLEVSVSFGG